MKDIVLHTDEAGFNIAVKKYAEKVTVKRDIHKELKYLLPDLKTNEDFFKDIELNFYNEIEKAYPEHIKLMKATKVPSIIDMDVSKLMNLISEYERVKDYKNPSISSFQILAETEEEARQLKAINNVIEAISEAEAVTRTVVYPGIIIQAFKGWIVGDIGTGLKFNYGLIAERKRLEKRREILN